MKNKKILKFILPIILLVALLASIYFIDTYKFYAKHKDYNSEYQIKVTYLIMDKDTVPDNVKIVDAVRKYLNEKLFSANQVVPLEKKGDYLYVDLSKYTSEELLKNTSDNVFTNNNMNGEVINDCEYDSKTKTIKVPISYYEKDRKQKIPIQFEIESRMTKKEFKNTKVVLNTKKFITTKRNISSNNIEMVTTFSLPKYSNKKVDKDNIEIYINNSKNKLDKNSFSYDSKSNIVTVNIPGILMNSIDVRVHKSVIKKAAALDYSEWNAIPLAHAPNAQVGDSYYLGGNPNYHYCTDCTNTWEVYPDDTNAYTYTASGERISDWYTISIYAGNLDNDANDPNSPYYIDVVSDEWIAMYCVDHPTGVNYDMPAFVVSVIYRNDAERYAIFRVGSPDDYKFNGQMYESYFKVEWPEEEKKAEIIVQKHINGDDNASLQGWNINLYSDSTCSAVLKTGTTNELGQAKFEDLDLGTTYYVNEVNYDSGRWTTSGCIGVTTPSLNEGNNGVYSITQQYDNTKKNGKVTVTKKLKMNGQDVAATSGWKINLYSDSSCSTAVRTGTTNNQGVVEFDGLDIGTYYVNEVEYDGNRWQSDGCVSVVVPNTAPYEISKTYYNTEKKYCLRVKKTDAEGGAALKDIKFNMAGKPLCTTDNNGICTFDNLEYADYTVTEELSTDNYCIDDTSTSPKTISYSKSELTLMDYNASTGTYSCPNNAVSKTKTDHKKYYCAVVKKVDYTTRELLKGATFEATINGQTVTRNHNWYKDNNDGYTIFFTGTSKNKINVSETIAPEGYSIYNGVLEATPIQLPCGLSESEALAKCKSITCTYDINSNTDTCKYSGESDTITGLNADTLPTYPEKKNFLNWYKVTENEETKANGAKFQVRVNGDNTKYIKVNGTTRVTDDSGKEKTCYVYDGLVSKSNASTLTSMNTNTNGNTTNGEVCIAKVPNGSYDVIETKPAKYHTFGDDSLKTLDESTSFEPMSDVRKFINMPTTFRFDKGVTSGDEDAYRNLTTAALKKIAFNIYDSNNNKLEFIKDSRGVYQYADNNIDPPQGTRVSDLYLDDDRQFNVEHLPEGTYSVKEKGNSSSDTCVCEDGSNCVGFYYPKYTNESDYKFTIDDCSNGGASSPSGIVDGVCTRSMTVVQNLVNKPTEITFTKADLYSYEDASDIVDFENDQERNDFDRITFKVKDANGNYLKFLKIGNHGTCKTDSSYATYRYVPEEMISSLTAAQRAALTDTLHTCGGHIRITHLCRGKKYYIEETSVPENSVFTLPENVADRTREYNIPCCEEDTTPSSKTAVINDKPTRVRFEKRDSKYNYLIPDETTTFKVYQCKNGVECHPADGETSDMKLMKFSARSVIRNDEEDPNDAEGLAGVEVYRAMSDSDVQSGQSYVTELHPYHGLLILRYLPSGYNYVLLETVAPKNYTLPKGRDAETRFTVVNNTVQVDEVDMPNVPTSLLIRKYDDEGNLIPGAQFKVYQGTTCDPNLNAMNQPKVELKLKTIRDGLYEYRPELDTNIIQTCSDANGTCSSIPVNTLTKLTYTDYLGTFADFDNVTNDEAEKIEIQQGEALIQYLEYGHCYIIEEVKAPNGYSLPKNPEDRFTMVTIDRNESYAQDTYKTLVNSPTPFTFYKYDEFNQLADGAEFKLQKLDNDKKYQDVTVTKEEKNGEFYYKADPNSTEKTITTKNGKATVYYLPAGQYRILETKPLPGKELGKNPNVATFFIDDSGNVYGNSIIVNKGKTEKIEIKSSSSAEFIIGPRTGTTVIKYGIIIAVLVSLITGLMILRKKMK